MFKRLSLKKEMLDLASTYRNSYVPQQEKIL
jgi:hypothetical protein